MKINETLSTLARIFPILGVAVILATSQSRAGAEELVKGQTIQLTPLPASALNSNPIVGAALVNSESLPFTVEIWRQVNILRQIKTVEIPIQCILQETVYREREYGTLDYEYRVYVVGHNKLPGGFLNLKLNAIGAYRTEVAWVDNPGQDAAIKVSASDSTNGNSFTLSYETKDFAPALVAKPTIQAGVSYLDAYEQVDDPDFGTGSLTITYGNQSFTLKQFQPAPE